MTEKRKIITTSKLASSVNRKALSRVYCKAETTEEVDERVEEGRGYSRKTKKRDY